MVLLSLFFLASCYVSAYTLTLNIHGDGINHSILAREISQNGSILKVTPFFIMNVSSGQPVYYPITYPETAHVLISLFYGGGQETALKLFSPLFAGLVAVFIYLILEGLSSRLGFASAILATMFNATRFIMTPLMEQPLLASMIVALFFYFRWVKFREIKYAVLSGIFVGFSIAVKQQGLLLALVIVIHLTMSTLASVRLHSIAPVAKSWILPVIAALVAVAPISDQVTRNGTIGYVPGSSGFAPGGFSLPFMQSKFPSDPNALRELTAATPYLPIPLYASLADAWKAFVAIPFYYDRSRTALGWDASFLLAASLVLAGFWYLWKKDRQISILLGMISISEVSASYQLGTPLYEYHVLGVAVLGVLVAGGIFQFAKTASIFFSSRYKLRFKHLHRTHTKYLIAGSLFLILLVGHATYVYGQYWGNSDRENQAHITAYNNLSTFLDTSNIPRNAIIIGAESDFRYYEGRDIFWLNEGGGALIPAAFRATNADDALRALGSYNASYIFIDNDQVKRIGLGDYIPITGLLVYIDNNSHFVKLYDDNVLRLYRIIYTLGA